MEIGGEESYLMWLYNTLDGVTSEPGPRPRKWPFYMIGHIITIAFEAELIFNTLSVRLHSLRCVTTDEKKIRGDEKDQCKACWLENESEKHLTNCKNLLNKLGLSGARFSSA